MSPGCKWLWKERQNPGACFARPKRCPFTDIRNPNDLNQKRMVIHSAVILFANGTEKEFGSMELDEFILGKMKKDEVSHVAKKDSLILRYG